MEDKIWLAELYSMRPEWACCAAASRNMSYAAGVELADLDKLQLVLEPVGQAGLAIAIMLIMGGVALGLRVADFLALKNAPRLFVGGLLTQLVGLPLLTYVVLLLVEVPASVALGMIVVACCPGGAVSNLLTWLGRGDVAYSVTLTTVSSVLAAVLTPTSILFWSNSYAPTAGLLEAVSVHPLAFLLQTTALLLVPLVAGMLLAAWRPGLAARLRRAIAPLGSLLLVAVIVYGVVMFFPPLLPVLPFLVLIAIVHNTLAFVLGGLAGVLLRAPRAIRRALTFEVGIQNSGLALVILLSQLKGLGGAAAIAATWGVWHIVAGGLIVIGLRNFDRWRS